jgi:squalene-hopene/tetraprenyl-beta-curcumene cyclase
MQRGDGSFGACAAAAGPATVEETALAVEALLTCGQAQAHEDAAIRGLKWLADAVEANRHGESAPIGLHFAKLWYRERLYPLIMSTSVLGQAARRYVPAHTRPSVAHSGQR